MQRSSCCSICLRGGTADPGSAAGNNRKHRRPAPFYGLEDDLPILIQLVTGLQHAVSSARHPGRHGRLLLTLGCSICHRFPACNDRGSCCSSHHHFELPRLTCFDSVISDIHLIDRERVRPAPSSCLMAEAYIHDGILATGFCQCFK